MNKTFFLSVFIIMNALTGRCTAQGNTDSMIRLLPHLTEDTAKANLIGVIARNYLDLNAKKFSYYTHQLLALSNKLNYDVGKVDAYNFWGIIADDDGDFELALNRYDTARQYAIKSGTHHKIGAINNNIGLIFNKIGDYQKALTYFLEAQKILEQSNKKGLLANVLSNTGLAYYGLRDYKKNLEYQYKALELREQMNDDYGTASTYSNIGMAFRYMQDSVKTYKDSAVFYLQKAASIQQKIGDNYGLAISYFNLGQEELHVKNLQQALDYNIKSLNIRQKLNDKYGLCYSYGAMGEVLRLLNRLPEAISYTTNALMLAREIKSDERISKANEVLASTYGEMKDYKKAYNASNQVMLFQRKAFDKEKTQQANELAIKYEVEKKDLTLKKNAAELRIKNVKIKQRNIQLILLALLLAASCTSFYLLYNRYRLKQEKKLQAEMLHQRDAATKAIVAAEEQERKRIAADLHDGLGQLFSAVKMNLSNIGNATVFTNKDAEESFEKTLLLVDESCREIRNISHQMMPNVLLKFGLSTALSDFIEKIKSKNLVTQLDAYGLNERLDANVETVLYRVIQESVNNIIKHAEASKLYIQINKEDKNISVSIEDNGKGFDVNNVENFTGIGLKNMRSRMEFLKGNIEFDSAPGRGTVVTVNIPL